MKRLISLIFAGLFSFFLVNSASAGVVTSEEVLLQEQRDFTQQQIIAMIDSEEVQQQLISYGVSPEQAKARVASLTQQELVQLNQEINQMPAGAGIVGTAVTVLIVLAILDILGVTDVFSFINPI
ncbi:PA2779 family protein [Aliikangiella sp. IMCC44653]